MPNAPGLTQHDLQGCDGRWRQRPRDSQRGSKRTELSPATFAFSDLLILDERIFLPTLMAPFRIAFALYDCHRHARGVSWLHTEARTPNTVGGGHSQPAFGASGCEAAPGSGEAEPQCSCTC